MPPTDDDKAFRWRLEDSYRTVTGEAFAKLVHEDGLEVKGPYQGYFYAMKHTTEGEELYRTLSGHKWIYQARRVATQANVAGGAVYIDISVATGQIARLINAYVANSGTNGLIIRKIDEDNANSTPYGSIPSGAATSVALPSIGIAASGSGNLANSMSLILAPGEKLFIGQTAAGAQNDTLTIAIALEMYNLATEPTWDKARSTNAADVTLAASTISTANTLQEVLC